MDIFTYGSVLKKKKFVIYATIKVFLKSERGVCVCVLIGMLVPWVKEEKK